MAKTFYSAAEAAELLGKNEDDLKAMVRDGKLREFRDAGNINFKVDEVDKIAAEMGLSKGGPDDSGLGGGDSSIVLPAGASASGELVLEPVEDSGIELAPSESDVLSLEEADPSEGTATGTAINKANKEGSVVPSVGVNVFDDDDLDEVVDPLAQTAVTDLGGLGIDGPGSGSGIMELSRESDDTSLGAELLDEIYNEEEEGGTVEMGDATRAGLEEAIVEPEEEDTSSGEDDELFTPEASDEPVAKAAAPAASTASRRVEVVQAVEYGPDAMSTGLTAMMVVAVLVMMVGGLAAAGWVRGVTPGIIETLYDNLLIFSGGSLGLAVIAMAVAFVVGKRSS
ncbi:MAG: helix-turn-helix domain-containing protein [Planctomycetota bacterium]|jgi:hypothetical protein